jgi:hypothetical protein
VAWSWRCETAAGAAVGGVDGQPFPSQADAETWIGENWRELVAAGVDRVFLLDGDREVYGPMSLHSA